MEPYNPFGSNNDDYDDDDGVVAIEQNFGGDDDDGDNSEYDSWGASPQPSYAQEMDEPPRRMTMADYYALNAVQEAPDEDQYDDEDRWDSDEYDENAPLVDEDGNYRIEQEQARDSFYDAGGPDADDFWDTEDPTGEMARIKDLVRLYELCNVKSTDDAGGNSKSAADEKEEEEKRRNQKLSAAGLARKEKEDALYRWREVRVWLHSHPLSATSEACTTLADYSSAPLHAACRSQPPVDVVEVLLAAAPETVQWADSLGFLPLHYASAMGASVKVLNVLVEHYIESKIVCDRRGRTPLHFVLGSLVTPATVQKVQILCSSGAAACPDQNGMLPIHYACAYGASEAVIQTLIDDFEDCVNAKDKRGRTPLHFALANAEREVAPDVVRLLLSYNKDNVNVQDIETNELPLNLLSNRAKHIKDRATDHQKRNLKKCLELYIKAKPRPTANFLTGLQSLPDDLMDAVAVHPVTQTLLNEKISQRFPTAALMLDFYFLAATIGMFFITVQQSIERRNDPDLIQQQQWAVNGSLLSPLYISCMYFAFREFVQIMSFMSLGLLRNYLKDGSNYIDLAFIFLTGYWAILMNLGAGDDGRFRTGTALSMGIFWMKALGYLRSILIEFAVFVSGVLFIVQRLLAFFTAFFIVIIAFAQMFKTVFRNTSYCEDEEAWYPYVEEGQCEAAVDQAFCTYWFSFLKTYTMMLGEVDENEFNSSKISMWLFVLFFFSVVIVLLNLLIAIVEDTYAVIKNERAAIVFWSNRLDFIAEMNIITDGPWKKRLRKIFMGRAVEREQDAIDEQNAGRGTWQMLIDQFSTPLYTGWRSLLTPRLWCKATFRVFTAFWVLPFWLLIGVLSAGWLWPPQIRERLFVQSVSKEGEYENDEEHEQVEDVVNQLKEVRDEVVDEFTTDRDDMVNMKKQMVSMKNAIQSEMKQIKRIVTILVDVRASTRR